MVDDRLYRLTIPGTIFLLFFSGWLIADPTIQFLTLLDSVNPFSVAIGGGMVVVVVGYLLGELGLALDWPISDVPLCEKQQCELKRHLLSVGAQSECSVTRLTVFTHLVLAREYKQMVEYFSRAWGRVVIACYCRISLLVAAIMYICFRLLLCTIYWSATPYEWYHLGWNQEMLTRLVVFTGVNVGVWKLLKSAQEKQNRLRYKLYQSLLERIPADSESLP